MSPSETYRRVEAVARDARSNDDLVKDDFWGGDEALEPLDEETLDEAVSTQMGVRWESRRRDAN